MTDTLPVITIECMVLPLADTAAAQLATTILQQEIERLWLADQRAGVQWNTVLDSITLPSLESEPGQPETPDRLGRRLAGAIRARLVGYAES